MENDLIDALRERARGYGVEISGLELLERGENKAVARIHRRRQEREYLALLSSHMSMPDSYPNEHWTGHPLLVLGAKITPRSADRLRSLGIDYLDANGNAHIEFDDVLIDVRGRSGDPIAAMHRVTSGTSNLFSPKRAQVIFALISWSDLVQAKLREIADAAMVSVGFVQKTLIDLESSNYLITPSTGRRERRLTNIDALINGWATSFPGGLGSPERTRSFRGDFDPSLLDDDGPHVYLSGEAAADWIPRHSSWSLYSEHIPTEAASAGRWTARSSAPNIFLREPFWRAPYGGDDGIRLRIAPPLLVYADLLASGESRQREAAERYREAHDGLRAR